VKVFLFHLAFDSVSEIYNINSPLKYYYIRNFRSDQKPTSLRVLYLSKNQLFTGS